jgi:hypothetical protein
MILIHLNYLLKTEKETFRISKAYSMQGYSNKYMYIAKSIIRTIPIKSIE